MLHKKCIPWMHWKFLWIKALCKMHRCKYKRPPSEKYLIKHFMRTTRPNYPFGKTPDDQPVSIKNTEHQFTNPKAWRTNEESEEIFLLSKNGTIPRRDTFPTHDRDEVPQWTQMPSQMYFPMLCLLNLAHIKSQWSTIGPHGLREFHMHS